MYLLGSPCYTLGTYKGSVHSSQYDQRWIRLDMWLSMLGCSSNYTKCFIWYPTFKLSMPICISMYTPCMFWWLATCMSSGLQVYTKPSQEAFLDLPRKISCTLRPFEYYILHVHIILHFTVNFSFLFSALVWQTQIFFVATCLLIPGFLSWCLLWEPGQKPRLSLLEDTCQTMHWPSWRCTFCRHKTLLLFPPCSRDLSHGSKNSQIHVTKKVMATMSHLLKSLSPRW